ncbi:MAG: rRNA pseudouridine synthase [Firmicutes bacterium]|nr:rRNA pseudouridine synthase [Bacillota bacterium]
MRLQKFLSAAGVCSRRAGEKLIAQGRVKVNGKTVTAMGVIIDPEKDVITVDNRPVRLTGNKEYLMLYKPVGVVTTLADPFGRQTVKDLLVDVGKRVFPVGRLDLDTSGLLLLTNDGELANRLTHPSYGVEKEYLARVPGLPAPETLKKLAAGVELEDGLTAPAVVRLIKGGKNTSLVSLTLREGRNRQVRRMLKAVGHPVLALKRVRFGQLTLAGLRPGQWRRLTPAEVRQLKEGVGLLKGRRNR